MAALAMGSDPAVLLPPPPSGSAHLGLQLLLPGGLQFFTLLFHPPCRLPRLLQILNELLPVS